MNARMTLSSWPLALSLAVILNGCLPDTHPFSGSAAMRIDVEVYKGPLSEEPETQWGNLWGLLDQVERWLIESNNLTRAIFANKGFLELRHDSPLQWPLPRIGNDGWTVPADKAALDGNQRSKWESSEPVTFHYSTDVDKACYKVQAERPWYSLKFWRLFGLLDVIDHYDCFALVTLIKDLDIAFVRARSLKSQYRNLRQPARQLLENDVRDFLQDIATLSGNLKFLAFRWTIATGAGHSLDTRIRLAHANAIVTTSESANQLHARADALLKQLSPHGLDRRELSPGVALRETEPTDFLHLYQWLNAENDFANSFAGIGTAEQRVKAIDRLFADHYWAKINTVYASGRGKVAMAFIKDDVGNWNLKSFDNDPDKLLKAYTDFSTETIKKAMEMAAKAAANGAVPGASGVAQTAAQTASKLLSLATANAFGPATLDPTLKSSNFLTALRKSLLLQLQEKKTQCKQGDNTEKDNLKECLTDLQNLIKEHSNIVDRIATGMSSPRQGEAE